VAGSKNWVELVTRILQILMTLAGVVAVVAIVIGGFQYMTSGGNEEQAEKGRGVLTNAVIGLILVIMAYTIITVVSNTIMTK
jgi:type IV secretory pathway VirB2 component (pilin)